MGLSRVKVARFLRHKCKRNPMNLSLALSTSTYTWRDLIIGLVVLFFLCFLLRFSSAKKPPHFELSLYFTVRPLKQRSDTLKKEEGGRRWGRRREGAKKGTISDRQARGEREKREREVKFRQGASSLTIVPFLYRFVFALLALVLLSILGPLYKLLRN